MTYSNNNRGISIAALNAYNKRRRAVLKILFRYGLSKNATNEQALKFLYKNLADNKPFFDEYTHFLIENKFLQNVNGKRNWIELILPAITALAPALGNIGQGKRIDAQEDVSDQQVQQEILRLMRTQASADAKKKRTQYMIVIAVIVSVFALLAVVIIKKK